MGFIDDAKDAMATGAEKVSRAVEDGVDRAKDRIDEQKAESDVKRAEAERDSIKKRNEVKEDLRD